MEAPASAAAPVAPAVVRTRRRHRSVDRLWFVNPRSGGGAGSVLAQVLESLGEHWADPARQPPAERLRRDHPRTVIAAGGDGTAAWIAGALLEAGCPAPLALWPLGTGNDLARVLGSLPTPRLHRLGLWIDGLAQAQLQRFDRFRLRGPGLDRHWLCYVSLGQDARTARRFHVLRRQHPVLMRGPAVNKAFYGGCGLAETGGAAPAMAGHWPFAVPAATGALLLSSIPSYGGGRCIDQRIRPDDGACDVHALPDGALRLGLLLAGLRRPPRLARVQRLAWTLHQPLSLQVDGEPLLAQPGAWSVELAGAVRLLAPRR